MENEYTFSGQKAGEKVIEVVPSHPYVLYRPGFKTVIILTAAIAIYLFFPMLWPVSLIATVVVSMYFINAFYSYKETLFMITNFRIFSINQKGFFKRKITEVELDKIIDMSSDTQGLSKVLLKYGDLTIRTAGGRESEAIVLENIAHPYSVQQRIACVLTKHKDKS